MSVMTVAIYPGGMRDVSAAFESSKRLPSGRYEAIMCCAPEACSSSSSFVFNGKAMATQLRTLNIRSALGNEFFGNGLSHHRRSGHRSSRPPLSVKTFNCDSSEAESFGTSFSRKSLRQDPPSRTSTQVTSSQAASRPADKVETLEETSSSHGAVVDGATTTVGAERLTLVDPFSAGPLDVESECSSILTKENLENQLAMRHAADGMRLDSDNFVRPTTQKPATLVLMRHGESMWNDLKLFTGDVDIPLTERGVMEAMEGGRAVAAVDFDMIFTSRLIRSKQTALLAMTQSQHKRVPVIVRGGYYGKGKTGDDNRLRLREAAWDALHHAECRMIPVYADPALNERCYGHLQGLNKELAAKEFGKDTVDRWRRSHNTSPPGGESLMDTAERSVGFFLSTIEPRLKEGKNVLVVAHGNVLRCIISHLAGLTTLEMLRLQVVTALPYTYSFDDESFASCCVLPPPSSPTSRQRANLPQGLASVLKQGDVDSLI